MTALSVVFGASGSLRRSLVKNILIAICLCIALASIILTFEFYEHLEENREDALAREAREIAAQLLNDAPDLGLDSDGLRFRGSGGLYRYTVFDRQGTPLVGGEEINDLVEMLQGAAADQAVFLNVGEDRAGAALVTGEGADEYIVLVTTSLRRETEAQFSELMHEVTEELHWILLGAAAILFAATLASHRALRPLGRVLREAQEIGPRKTDLRLSTTNLPGEVVPLVGAVNEALNRLDQGYRSQRDFSSNVAHEVRTPLAVLRSSIDRIDDRQLRDNLSEDIKSLEQMFEQLIDLSRAEALGVAAFGSVDLHAVAVALAREAGVQAMREGKRLAVTGSETRVVQGHRGLLQIALGNLLRNAINYAPADSEIEIEVTDCPAGWKVLDRGPGIPDDQKTELFERFRRGKTRGRAGSGIGLAIVKSVADAHDADITVENRPGGGSVFHFAFRKDQRAPKTSL